MNELHPQVECARASYTVVDAHYLEINIHGTAYCTSHRSSAKSMAAKGPPPIDVDAEQEAKTAFSALRPVCVQVMSAPSLETLGALEAVVRGMRSIHPHLVDYVVLPLRMIFRRVGR